MSLQTLQTFHKHLGVESYRPLDYLFDSVWCQPQKTDLFSTQQAYGKWLCSISVHTKAFAESRDFQGINN